MCRAKTRPRTIEIEKLADKNWTRPKSTKTAM